jgi:hypothetical protein
MLPCRTGRCEVFAPVFVSDAKAGSQFFQPGCTGSNDSAYLADPAA